MSDDIIDFYKKVVDQVNPENTTSDNSKQEIIADPFQRFLSTLAENLEKTEPKEFKQIEEQEEVTDPFAKFLSNMASIVKEDKKVQTDEQIKEATIGFINKLKTDNNVSEVETQEEVIPVVKKLPKKANVKVTEKQNTVTNKIPSFNTETGLPEIQEQKEVESVTQTQPVAAETPVKSNNTYVKELSQADKNKKIPEKIAKGTDIKSIIEKQVREAVNKLRQEFGQNMMSSGGGGTVAVQYADGGTMNGDLNVTGKYLSGGTDLATIFSGGGGQSDRLVAGNESFILNSNGTLTIPNNTIRLEDDINLVLESESSPLLSPLTGTLYNRLFLSPYGFFAYDNNSNSITIDSVGNDITITTLDSNDWIFRDDGTLVGPNSALTIRGTLNSLGPILSGGIDLADIFITHETDSQTLSYIPSSYELSISNGNTVSLASLSSVPTDLSFLSVSGNWNTAYDIATAYQNVSGDFATTTYTDSRYLPLTGGEITGNLYVDGNVGIGTTTPVAKLDVKGDGSIGVIRVDTGDNTGDAFEAYSIPGYAGFQAYNRSYTTTVDMRMVAKNYIFLGGTNSGDLVENFSINSNGNVGIGSTTPDFKLVVNDSSYGAGWVTRFQKNIDTGDWVGILFGGGPYREGFIQYFDDGANSKFGFGIGGDPAAGVAVLKGGRLAVSDAGSTPVDDGSGARIQTTTDGNSIQWNNAYNIATAYQDTSGSFIQTVNGTANQIDIIQTGSTVTASLPNSAVFPGDVSITGNLTVAGSAAYINVQNLIVGDNLIYLNNNNYGSNILDTGFVSHFTQAPLGYNHSGLVRRAGQGTPGVWTLFSGLTSEPLSAANIDWSDRNITIDSLSANLIGNVTGNYVTVGTGDSNQWNSAYTVATVYQNASGSFVSNTAINSLTGNWNTAYQTVSTIPYTFIASTSSIDTTYGSNSATGIFSGSLGGDCNLASGNYSTIVGGFSSCATGIATFVGAGSGIRVTGDYAVAGGGIRNTASGYAATIAGGWCNSASSSMPTIGGGRQNSASGAYTTIAGGRANTADRQLATVGGGCGNTASGYNTVVAGGLGNSISSTVFNNPNNSVISGGRNNCTFGLNTVVAGGCCNFICGIANSSILGGCGNLNPLRDSVIGGGIANHTGGFAPFNITTTSISGNGSQTRLTGTGIQSCFSSPFTTNNVSVYYATDANPLSAGTFATATIAATGTNFIVINTDYSTCTSSGLSATSIYVYDRSINNTGYDNVIGGGKLNTASGCYSFIGSGRCNSVCTGVYNAIIAGDGNRNCAPSNSTVAGGNVNLIDSAGNYAFIAGGRSNTVSNWYSSVGGGSFNSIGGQNSVIAGGSSNCITSNGSNIAGGCLNRVCNTCSNIGGGVCNIILTNGTASTIGGGRFNYNPLFNSSIESGSFNHMGGYAPNNITAAVSISGNGTNTALIQTGIGSCFSASNTTGAVSLVWMTSGTANSTLSSANFTTANIVTNAANCIIVNGDYSTCTATGLSACSIWVYDRCLNLGGCFNFIGGGMLNTASGNCGVIGGGFLNRATRPGASVLGGCQNSATGSSSTIVGGGTNTASAYYSTVIGGRSNNASGYTSIAGGWNNTVSGNYSSVGGRSNTVTGKGSSAVGGLCNTVSGNYSSIVGGVNNTASGNYSFVASGSANNIAGTYSSIAGGFNNCINAGGGGNFIGGGCCNSTSFSCAVVGGGWCNSAGGIDVVVGGALNTASANYSVVVGGVRNNANSNYGFIAGGQNNSTNGFANTFILGSSLSASVANYTYVNNISSQGVVTAGGLITSNYTGAADSSVLLLGGNTKGGAGYNDFLRVYNPAATSSLWFRSNITGGLEVINSAYTQALLGINQTGNILVYNGSTATSSTSNDGLSGTIQFNNNNSQLYDDGNFHIHSRGSGQSMWINTNGGDIRVGQQAPINGGSIANSIIFGGASNTSPTAYVNVLGFKTYSITGYGYLNSGGAGTVAGNSGNVNFGLYVANRTQSAEVDVTSDERVKNIQGTIPLEDAIKFVKSVNGIKYTWKEGFGDEGLKTGFGAQSVHKAGFEHMISHITNDKIEGKTDADGWVHPDKTQLSMGYNQVIPYHHEVIKSLLNRIEELEATVKELKDK